MKPFTNRMEAGFALAEKLMKYKNGHCIVLAIPRGGVPVGAVVAKELNLPLQVWLCKKIGHPFQKEYAIGAVTLSDVYLVPHTDVSDAYIELETERVRQRLRNMQQLFSGLCSEASPEGKTVLLVDDGIATGNTLIAAIRLLKKSKPSRIVVAVPVASKEALALMETEADECICLHTPGFFTGVGAYYEDFAQVTDEEVAELLKQNR